MRKLAATALCFLFLRPAPAGVVPYPPASELTQILNHAQLVLQLAKQAEMVRVALQQLSAQTIQGKLFTGLQFGNLAANLVQLARTVRNGQGLSNTMSNLDVVFRSAYPGYLKSGVDFNVQYDDWSNTTRDTISEALRKLGIHSEQLSSDAQTMGTIQRFAGSAVGETQVLQAGVMVANMQVDQLAKLQDLMMTQLKATVAVQAQEQHEKAVRQNVQRNAFGPVKFQATN